MSNVETLVQPSELLQWQPIHGAQVIRDAGGGLLFSDGAKSDYHLMRVTGPQFKAANLRLRITATPAPTCNTELYINHWGGMDVLRVGPDGRVLDPGLTSSLSVQREPDSGRLHVEATFFNSHPTLSIGTTRGPYGRYEGSGTPQYLIDAVEVTRLPDVPLDRRIRLIDVGAAGGLHREWRRVGGAIVPICFEPNPASAALLGFDVPGFEGGKILMTGLLDRDGPQTLNVTRHGGCSSVLEPDPAVLGRYAVAPIFDVMKRIEVNCRRYDSMHASGEVPVPDLVKIDVQGAEYEVLSGFGSLLDQVLAVELESHLYPIYRGQKLLGDVTKLLDAHGLGLRKMEPQYSFDGELLEFNLFSPAGSIRCLHQKTSRGRSWR